MTNVNNNADTPEIIRRFQEQSILDGNFITQTLVVDTEISQRLKEFKNKGDRENVLKMYSLRRRNFHEASESTKKLPISIGAQAYLNQHIGEMEHELKIYELENDFAEQVSNLVTRIERLESDIKKIMDLKSKEENEK